MGETDGNPSLVDPHEDDIAKTYRELVSSGEIEMPPGHLKRGDVKFSLRYGWVKLLKPRQGFSRIWRVAFLQRYRGGPAERQPAVDWLGACNSLDDVDHQGQPYENEVKA